MHLTTEKISLGTADRSVIRKSIILLIEICQPHPNQDQVVVPVSITQGIGFLKVLASLDLHLVENERN